MGHPFQRGRIPDRVRLSLTIGGQRRERTRSLSAATAIATSATLRVAELTGMP